MKYKKIYYKELPPMIIEVKKPHNLPFVSWRHKNVHGVVLVQVHRSENQIHQWFKSKGKKLGREFSLLPFCSIQALQWVGRYPPTLGRAICVTESNNSNANLFRNTLRDLPKITVNNDLGLSCPLVKLTHKCNHPHHQFTF